MGVGPKYMLAKLIIVAVIAVGVFISLYRPMYHVSARFNLPWKTSARLTCRSTVTSKTYW